jgi:hypothetical protein
MGTADRLIRKVFTAFRGSEAIKRMRRKMDEDT